MRKRCQVTSYGKLVLARLEAKGMTVWELAQEVERRSGRFCTEKFIYNYVRGVPTPYPQDNAIRDILGLRRKGGMTGGSIYTGRAGGTQKSGRAAGRRVHPDLGRNRRVPQTG